jgi:hypothetical protein
MVDDMLPRGWFASVAVRMEEQRSLVLLGRACVLHKVMLRAFVPQVCVVLVRAGHERDGGCMFCLDAWS